MKKLRVYTKKVCSIETSPVLKVLLLISERTSAHSKRKSLTTQETQQLKAVGGRVNATAQRAPTKADEDKPDTRRSSNNKSSKSVVNYTRSDDFADACTPALYEHQQEALEFF